MFTLFGIVLLVGGAILTFAVERQADGVDLQLAGWILMAGGGLSLLVGMIRAATLSAGSPGYTQAPRHTQTPGHTQTPRVGEPVVEPADVDGVHPERERRAA